MSVELKSKPAASATPIHTTDRASFTAVAPTLPAATRRWLSTVGFDGAPDSFALLPDDKGSLKAVWAGVHAAVHPYALSALPRALPAGNYRLDDAALYDRVTDSLLNGGVVGWFQGRAEFGPRALGNRSILADPRRAERDLGWKATRTLADMCADTWRWQSANPLGYR